tara:strand:- start:642 stop:1157 length:516 start_codon:yes stop_codon:yes gene_type:complete
MAFAESFSVSQSALSPSVVTLTDTSTGSDGAITSRVVYVSDSDGTYLTGDGTVDFDVWDWADASIDLDILTESTAASIRVDWLNSVDTILYTVTDQYCLAQYAKNFAYYLVQQLAQTFNVIQDTSYFSNLAQFWTNLRGAINAIEVSSDLSASQNCLNRCTEMQNDESKYF